jgi:hypothetical protein
MADNNVDLRAKGVNAKLIQGQYGDFWSIGMNKEEFITWLKDQPAKNGWVNLTLGSQKADRMKGTLKLDTFVPKNATAESSVDELPF